MFVLKSPQAQALLFDNAPSHRKCSDDSLNVDCMNVGPGGKQPKMRDSIFNGQLQSMVLPDGRPKGMKLVLQEKGVNTQGMNAAKMRETLNKYEDFANKRSLLEEIVESRGHLCMFYPKYHCEFNPIERCWCHAKKHTRAHATGFMLRLRKTVHEGLDSCTPELIKKFMRKSEDYVGVFREGSTCWNVDQTVKEYKSHRHVFDNA